MTISSDPAALVAAAVRADAEGRHNDSAAMYQEAADNYGSLQIVDADGKWVTAAATPFTTAGSAIDAAYVASAATCIASSHVFQSKGHDGSTVSG